MLRRMKIGTRVNLLIAVPLLALLALTCVAFVALQRASVRGDEYKQLKAAEALRSDIVPPTANLLRAWAAVNQISVLVSSPQSDRTDLEIIGALTDLKSARTDFETAVAYWRAQPVDPVVKSAFEKSADAGATFFAKVDAQLTPAVDARHPAEVIDAVRSLGDDYAVQQSTIFRALDLVQAQVDKKEASTDNFVGRVFVLLAGAVGTLLFIVLLIAFLVRRSIVNPILGLSNQARRVAERDLPTAVHQLQSMPADAPAPTVRPFVTGTHDELADLSASFNSVQNAALDLAAEQARSRRIVSDNLVNIARRTQSLLGRSLTSLADMEQAERDPHTLENLFHLDHLSTRMRRNAQSLLVLAGAEQNRLWSMPLPIGDVVRAAISEIESYSRVEFGDLGAANVQGALAPDIAHLLAELLENATTFSPPSTTVMVVGRSVASGHQLAIIDYGIGMSVAELDEANDALRRRVDFAESSSKMLGLQVVSRLANRMGIEVILAQTAGATGVTAIIKLPSSVLEFSHSDAPDEATPAPAVTAADGPAEAELAMVGAAPPAPAQSAPPKNGHLAAPGHLPQPTLPSQPHLPQPASAATLPPASTATLPPASAATLPPASAMPLPPPVQLPPPANAAPTLTPVLGGGGGLPKRVRGAQLPDLGAAMEADPAVERPAEQVRSSLTSLQRGTELGRQNGTPAGHAPERQPWEQQP